MEKVALPWKRLTAMSSLDRYFGADHPKSRPPTLEEIAQYMREGGTFKDSKNAPLHRWFYYPTGFSLKLVYASFRTTNISKRNIVLDPFVGSGTTSVVAKSRGIDSVGIEAHPFVIQMAKAKLNWEIDLRNLRLKVQSFLSTLSNRIRDGKKSHFALDSMPELLRKLYSDKALENLLIARELLEEMKDEDFFLFFKIALATALRKVSQADTGWPYMLPKKKKSKERSPVEVLGELLNFQLTDLKYVQNNFQNGGKANIIDGDARDLSFLDDESLSLAFTSPPYLNNFDYSDRTRMEMYFFGEAFSWGEITKKVRTKLIISATTQIRRNQWNLEKILDPRIPAELREKLYPKIRKLSKLRLNKGGKKSYDIMVGGYFNDMHQNFAETFRVLKGDAKYILILGDSAPYGVYIPTDEYLGELGKAVGFSDYKIHELRKRGDKWKSAPKHTVPLRESILVLQK